MYQSHHQNIVWIFLINDKNQSLQFNMTNQTILIHVQNLCIAINLYTHFPTRILM